MGIYKIVDAPFRAIRLEHVSLKVQMGFQQSSATPTSQVRIGALFFGHGRAYLTTPCLGKAFGYVQKVIETVQPHIEDAIKAAAPHVGNAIDDIGNAIDGGKVLDDCKNLKNLALDPLSGLDPSGLDPCAEALLKTVKDTTKVVSKYVSRGLKYVSDIISTFTVTKLMQLIGIHIPRRLCVPQACKEICDPTGWFGGCARVCILPYEICVNLPFYNEQSEVHEQRINALSDAHSSSNLTSYAQYDDLFEKQSVGTDHDDYDHKASNLTVELADEPAPNLESLAVVESRLAHFEKFEKHAARLFEDPAMLAHNFHDFAIMVVQNATTAKYKKNLAEVHMTLAGIRNTNKDADNTVHTSAAPTHFDDWEFGKLLIPVLSVGHDTGVDIYAHMNGGLDDPVLSQMRDANDKELMDAFFEVAQIAHKLGATKNDGKITFDNWHAGKSEVLNHVKGYVTKTMSSHKAKYKEMAQALKAKAAKQTAKKA